METITAKGTALGNAKAVKGYYNVKLILDKPIRFKGQDINTVVLTSTNNHNRLKTIVTSDKVAFTGYVKEVKSNPLETYAIVLVKTCDTGSLDRLIRLQKKQLASCPIIE